MLKEDLLEIPARRKRFMNLTSLIDVMFILLLFLLVTTTFSTNSAIKVNLPEVKGDVTAESGKGFEIAVTKEEKVILNGQTVEITKIREQVENLLKNSPEKKPSVNFKVDKGVAYGFVLKVMAEIKKTGIQTLVAITESQEEPV